MATYNGAQYLCEQLDSILCQTIRDFELVVCDDCSTDGTFEILEDYSRKDNRIRIYRNQSNQGFRRNFEIVINKCIYEFIALSDQDDIWLPDHLEMLLVAMKPNIQVVCGKPVFVDQNNVEMPKNKDYFFMFNPPTTADNVIRYIFLNKGTYQGASMLIRKSFFDIALPIPQGVDYHDTWFATMACFTGGILYVDRPTMRYRRHIDNITINEGRTSAIRRFVGITLLNHVPKDRQFYIDNIRKRLPCISKGQNKILNRMETMIRRRNTFLGRLLNVPYILYHYNAVFACDLKHMFKV